MQPRSASAGLAIAGALLGSAAAPAQSPDAESIAAPEAVREGESVSETATTVDDETAARPAPRERRGPRLTALPELLVEADRPLSAASSDVIRGRDFALRPHSTTQEMLNNVPGLVVVQHAGGGKAVQYFLRGFDSDHGTDIALFTDGIPVNRVTHGHGQGYADINYLIPETVDTLQLYKGPYFYDLGDFATGGALRITTNDARYNFLGKLTFNPTAEQRLSFLASVYSGDWDGSGQIPLRIVGGAPGEIDRFASLDPSEGGSSDRQNLSAQWNYTPSAEEEWSAQLWGSRYHLRLFSNFTFFKDTGLRFYTEPGSARIIDRCAGFGDDCPALPAGSIPLSSFIPGDGIQQDDTRLLFGGFVQYARYYSLNDVPGLGQIGFGQIGLGQIGLDDVPMQSVFGLATRRDDINVGLQRQVRRNPFFDINKVDVGEQSLSGYWGQQVFFNDWLRFEGGVRGDVFFFDVRNRLPTQGVDANFSCLPNAQGVCPSSSVPTNADGAVVIQGNEVDGLASPKANVVLGPWRNTEAYLNFGYGFHSNDARAVVLTGTRRAGAGARL